jgi:hypothetical protein
MKSVRILIPDLFLPPQVATQACADLNLPALETILARSQRTDLPLHSLESWLCDSVGVAEQVIAPITLRADGMEAGDAYWLRADPVYLNLQRDHLVMQSGVPLTAGESAQLCFSLNQHFAADGLKFLAPHPHRWYLQLESDPGISTHPLAQVSGKDVHGYLPQGERALHWHGVLNEIQMLLFDHPVNQLREQRGELPVNSVWLWGGGNAVENLVMPYSIVLGDSALAAAFAQGAGVTCRSYPPDIARYVTENKGEILLVWEGLHRALKLGDLHAWREYLLLFEQRCALPLLQALRAGHIDQLRLDAPQGDSSRSFILTRSGLWKLWRRLQHLDKYAV